MTPDKKKENAPAPEQTNQILVTKIRQNQKEFLAVIGLDSRRNFTDLALFPEQEESFLDQIYAARVSKVVRPLQAAFVKITPDQTAYLPLTSLEPAIFIRRQSPKKELSEGDELLVQITRDEKGAKAPVASAKLTLFGRFCLLLTGEEGLRISQKITGEQKKELLEFLAKTKEAFISSFGEDEAAVPYAILLRTNALQTDRETLREDLFSLLSRFRSLIHSAPHMSLYGVLSSPAPPYIRTLQPLAGESVCRVCTDDQKIYEQIDTFLPYLRTQGRLCLYTDKSVPLSVLYSVQHNLKNLRQKRVWLPSGGNIIVEEGETLTSIDVNSAKSSANRAAVLTANREAAKEIPRQMRLRSLSGMILVDFINMKEEADRQEVLSILRQELKKDTVPSRFVDITGLGLAELTRKKVHKSLGEVLDGA